MKEARGFSDYLDEFPGGVCLVSADKEEKVLAVNQELIRMYRCNSEKEFCGLTGRFFRNMAVKEDDLSLQRISRQWIRRGESGSLEFRMRCYDGSICGAEGIAALREDAVFGPVWVVSLVAGAVGLMQHGESGLLDRISFYRVSEELVREDVRKGLLGQRVPLYVNLTNFKSYNSKHGIKAGDELILEMTGILREAFPETPMSRLAADHFILLPKKADFFSHMDKAADAIRERIGDPAVQFKAGAAVYGEGYIPAEKMSPENLREPFDYAKMAADSIKGDSNKAWAVYRESMGQSLADEAYVLREFDRALKRGYIHVFYQPVVRTLTGKICSMEALARWEDPERGMIMPSAFIPVLERQRLVYRLDAYVIERTARLYRKLKKKKEILIPVSVNLSRVDFDVMDPFAFVESVVARYQLSRQLFRIEVTESALTTDGDKLKAELQRFQNAGYQCWLDDFGSGQSSLNVLKDFPLDELKIDMAFLRHFNEKSCEILESIVFMAKKLSIHTLAEGVETKEQAEILRRMGCEKIQGWYYGKPLPYEDMMEKSRAGGLLPEMPLEELVMEKAGLVNVMEDRPVALFMDDGENFTILQENASFRREVHSVVKEPKILNEGNVISHHVSAYENLRPLLESSLSDRKEKSMIYVKNGQLIRGTMKILAGSGGLYTGRAGFYNMTVQEKTSRIHDLDAMYRSLAKTYDSIYCYRQEKRMLEVVTTSMSSMEPGRFLTLKESLRILDRIHPDDRKDFLAFIRTKNLDREISLSPQSMAAGVFRIIGNDGGYRWKEVDALFRNRQETGDVIYGIKDATMEQVAPVFRKKLLSWYADSHSTLQHKIKDWQMKGELLEALKQSADFKFFWKDRNRRFLGASRAFLSYYGLAGESDILGKTDEDIGWHVDNSDFRREEKNVLEKGRISRNVLGRCIIHGKIHLIRATKIPYYEGNCIAGLLGWFVDLEADKTELERNSLASITDPETGFLNLKGLAISGKQYEDAYYDHGEDFEGILLDIPEIETFGKVYGPACRKDLLAQVSEEIREAFPQKEVLGRVSLTSFLVLMKAEDRKETGKRMDALANVLHKTHSARGCSCTPYLTYTSAYGSETGSIDEMLLLLSKEIRLEKEPWG
ncbi:EAL domain-containing protein [Dialister sp.]|uniref:EAL domain-containing protein n=1 Tax=Dialister sp. TaxID=1955814 RepID=UPI003F0C23A4